MAVGNGRVYHANVNCSDLERSLAWYRDRLGLSVWAHTAPEAEQDGAAFGLSRARWDAFILGSGGSAHTPPVVDLLEWRTPGPIGRPHASAADRGFAELIFERRDIEDQRQALTGASASPTGPTSLDPDGTGLRFEAGPNDRFSGLVVRCADPERSASFYATTLGLHEAPPRAGAPTDGAADADALCFEDDAGFSVRLLRAPAGGAAPYESANHLGIFRVAMLTDDIDADHEELVSGGIRCWSAPATLEMGPGIPGLRALLFADPDGAAWELIEPGT